MRWRRGVLGLAVVLGAASACTAILGIDPPPTGGRVSTTADAAPVDAAGAADAGSGDDASTPSVACAALDASADGSATTYFALDPGEANGGSWQFFDTVRATTHLVGYAGGAFDGRYVYFSPRASVVLRFDTQAPDGGAFDAPAAWSTFDVTALGAPGGFFGAAFDGRYVYFVPWQAGTAPTGVLARYDTKGTFASPASWTTFDMSTLAADGGVATTGFIGASFDGRYVYFVPHSDGVPDGRVVRLDTAPARDAGVPPPADAGSGANDGDAAVAPGPLASASLWTSFDLSTVSSTATGFYGAVFDGAFVHFIPSTNDAFGSVVHGGGSGIAARFRDDGGFGAASSWSTYDLTEVNGLAFAFQGGAFDGRYVYLAPRAPGIAVRLDTQAAYASPGSWSTYDVTRAIRSDAATTGYTGAAFDGRFVYYVPGVAGFGEVLRYDTWSAFGADCAWSTVELPDIGPPDAGMTNYNGAIFDGQYLYLAPTAREAARFHAKTPAALPALPAFSGSFL